MRNKLLVLLVAVMVAVTTFSQLAVPAHAGNIEWPGGHKIVQIKP
ncbi:MAG: hypothetical protein U0822_10100 [Anaerolineae bacterium]